MNTQNDTKKVPVDVGESWQKPPPPVEEDCHEKTSSRRKPTVSLQTIFNVAVGVALVLMCFVWAVKYRQLEEKLQEQNSIRYPSHQNDLIIPDRIDGLGDQGGRDETADASGGGTTAVEYPEDVGILASCDALKKAGARFNGVYLIDPDGPSTGLDPFSVVCDMTSDLTVGYTTIHHDKEEDGNVNHAEAPGSRQIHVTYDLESAQIEAVKNVSSSCRQFIKYACIASLFTRPWPFNRSPHQYWVSVDGRHMVNWGGVPTGTRGCACGLTRSCDNVNQLCNCDKNDLIPRMDQGYLTDKATLPVSQLRFGDTGFAWEKGVYTLGPFQCA